MSPKEDRAAAFDSARALAALVLEIHDKRIHGIYAIGNPDKLQALPDSA